MENLNELNTVETFHIGGGGWGTRGNPTGTSGLSHAVLDFALGFYVSFRAHFN